MLRMRRMSAASIGTSLAFLSVAGLGLGLGLPAASPAAAATTNPCGPLFTDPSGDAGGDSQADIVTGSAADASGKLTTTLTVQQLSTTVVTGATANEYYVVFKGADGADYFTNAEVSITGDVTYSYGTATTTAAGSTTYSPVGSATGTFDTAHNAVNVTVPLSVVGGGQAGSVLTNVFGETDALVGAPSNGVASGGSLQVIDHAGPQYDYEIGAVCGGTPPPTPTPTDTSTPPACTDFCFGAPVVLPKSGQTGSTSDSCFNPCGEPSLAVSPVDGTLYVSTPRTLVACCNTQASPVWKSSDNGQTWSDPIFPSGAENATTGGDTELAIDKRGTVYEGELWLGSDSIYISSDKGQTWDWSPASHDLLADREWFAYAPAEDALYGFWDGFKGLMVAKAPLNTPLGSNAARFFPIQRVVVPECVAAVAVSCPNVPVDSVNGTPVIHQATSPGRPSVSPVDGTLYFPFPYQVAGKGIGIAYTTDGGTSFQYSFVAGAGHGGLHDTGNDFPVSAVDSAGRLYIAWVEDKGDGYNLYLTSSTDKGATWTAPMELSKGISNTAVFPNVVAGAPGQVAVSWYGTDATGDPNGVPSQSSWNVYAAEITGMGGTPAVTTTVIQQGFHQGPICTHGLGCTGNSRNLLDFFDMQLDRTGELGVVYARDQAANPALTEIVYSRQSSGCVLTAACGVAASTTALPAVVAPLLLGAGVVGSAVGVRGRRRRLALA